MAREVNVGFIEWSKHVEYLMGQSSSSAPLRLRRSDPLHRSLL